MVIQLCEYTKRISYILTEQIVCELYQQSSLKIILSSNLTTEKWTLGL